MNLDYILNGAHFKCLTCGYVGRKKQYSKGNLIILILLIIVFFPLAILYILWDSFSSYQGCPRCSSRTMVKLNEKEKEIEDLKREARE